MKITHVIIGLNIGGAETMLKKLIQFQTNSTDYKHTVISLTSIGPIGLELLEEGVEVRPLGMKSIFSFPVALFKLIKIFRTEKPDIVQTWMYHADLIGGLAAKIAGIGCILWGIRSTKIGIGNNRFTLCIQKLCAILSPYIPNKIICVAEKSRDFHVCMGYDRKKMIVIHNGFDLDKFSLNKKLREKMRQELNIQNRFVIGSVGRFNPAKNHLLLILVAEKIIKKIPNVTFLLIGRGVNNIETEFHKKIKEKKLFSYFMLIGEVEDTAKYYQAMDIFCLHSDTEGFPNVLGEAMASGLPCISTDAGDARKLLGDDSMVVDCGDTEGIVQRILILEQLSVSERKLLGSTSRRKIKDNYSLSEISKKFANIYEQYAHLGE